MGKNTEIYLALKGLDSHSYAPWWVRAAYAADRAFFWLLCVLPELMAPDEGEEPSRDDPT